MFLTIVNVLCPTLLATDCRAGSPRLVHFADTTLPFDGNLHDRVASCCISLIISSRYLIVCLLHRRLASSCRWCRWCRWCWSSSSTVGSRECGSRYGIHPSLQPCAPLNVLISTLVLVSALVQVVFLLLLHTSCSCTPPRTLNTCTLLPPCIDACRVLRHLRTCIARPLCIDGATSCLVSCFARQLRVSCRVVPWPSHPSLPYRSPCVPYGMLSSTSSVTSHFSLITLPRRALHRSPSHSLPSNTALSSIVPQP
jgi:hypothetical protein